MLLHGRVGDSTPGETEEGQSVRLAPAGREATRGTLAVNIGIGLIGHTVMTRRHANGAKSRVCVAGSSLRAMRTRREGHRFIPCRDEPSQECLTTKGPTTRRMCLVGAGDELNDSRPIL